MSVIIYPYKMGSTSAKELAGELGCRRVYPNRKYRYKDDHLIVNWGCSEYPEWDYDPTHMLNDPDAVAIASNKLLTLEALFDSDVPTLNFLTEYEDAKEYFNQDHSTGRLYCRTLLRSHSGKGIVVATNADEVVDAPLYTEGVVGYRDEYRVHVFGEYAIDVQMKRKKISADPNVLVRNHDNGYVYCREDIPDLEYKAREDAVRAVAALGLDFGAVDMIVMRDAPDKYYIIEVNTAPGLVGSTLLMYARQFRGYYGS
jgi:carbamoylphosphate synthase large subunit